jgi:GH24 family phage-related lysozyme (muramidase)
MVKNKMLLASLCPLLFACTVQESELAIFEEVVEEEEELIVDGYHVSEFGKKFIKKEESCRLIAYQDGNGYSIGYGHHGKDVYDGMEITMDEAEAFFQQDIEKVEASLNRLLKNFDCNFKQGFVDGMASLIYNCGESGIRRSEFYAKLRKCRIRSGIIDESDIRWTIGHVKKKDANTHRSRRHREHELMIREYL